MENMEKTGKIGDIFVKILKKHRKDKLTATNKKCSRPSFLSKKGDK